MKESSEIHPMSFAEDDGKESANKGAIFKQIILRLKMVIFPPHTLEAPLCVSCRVYGTVSVIICFKYIL